MLGIVQMQPAGTTVTAGCILGKTATAETIVTSTETEMVPTTIDTLTEHSTRVTGTAEPNAWIEIKNHLGVLGSGLAGIDGNYNVGIVQMQPAGTTVTVTASLAEKTAAAEIIVSSTEIQNVLYTLFSYKTAANEQVTDGWINIDFDFNRTHTKELVIEGPGEKSGFQAKVPAKYEDSAFKKYIVIKNETDEEIAKEEFV